MDLKYLPEEMMFPLVKKAVHLDTEKLDIPQRIAESFELSFFCSGSGTFYIDGKGYEIEAGAVCFSRPGQTLYGIAPYSCDTISFDLLDYPAASQLGESENIQGPYGIKIDNMRCNEMLDSFPSFFYTMGNQKNTFAEVVELFCQRSTGSVFRQNALLMQILSSYYYVVVKQRGRDPVVQKCVQYIQQNYAEKITLEDLHGITNYSALHIRRKFLSEMGTSPNEFLRAVRLAHAKRLLAETSMSIGAIALNCGFASEPYFYTVFRSELGITPGEYRETMQGF